MLVARYKCSLGKSSHGGQTLYDHAMDCVRVAHKLLTDERFTPPSYPKRKRNQLLFAVFVHDVGKLDFRFQATLRAARDGLSLPPERVKHEASTVDFESLVSDTEDDVREHLQDVLDYEFNTAIDLDDTLAFALTHHGLFYMSFEERGGQVRRRVRREWTVFNYSERFRITLADLLIDYHPLGGLPIIADLLGSFCHEQRLVGPGELIQSVGSLRELLDALLREGATETVEKSMEQYDQRAYGLRDLITLLAGGLV